MILSIFVLFSLVNSGIQLSIYSFYYDNYWSDANLDFLDFWQNISDSVEQQNTWNRVWDKLTSVPCWWFQGLGGPTFAGNYYQFNFYRNQSQNCSWNAVVGNYVDEENNVEYDGIMVGNYNNDLSAFVVGKGEYENYTLYAENILDEFPDYYWFNAAHDPLSCSNDYYTSWCITFQITQDCFCVKY